jgi:hypothetical protein
LKFQYKTTGNNNTLGLYLKAFSGNKTFVWRLRGNHGQEWKKGAVTYWPREALSVIFLI